MPPHNLTYTDGRRRAAVDRLVWLQCRQRIESRRLGVERIRGHSFGGGRRSAGLGRSWNGSPAASRACLGPAPGPWPDWSASRRPAGFVNPDARDGDRSGRRHRLLLCLHDAQVEACATTTRSMCSAFTASAARSGAILDRRVCHASRQRRGSRQSTGPDRRWLGAAGTGDCDRRHVGLRDCRDLRHPQDSRRHDGPPRDSTTGTSRVSTLASTAKKDIFLFREICESSRHTPCAAAVTARGACLLH